MDFRRLAGRKPARRPFRQVIKHDKIMKAKTLILSIIVALAACPAFVQAQPAQEKGEYSAERDGEHAVLFVLDNRPVDLQEIRTDITKYIWKYYPGQKLKITQIKIDGELENTPLIHITGFAGSEAAMNFYSSLKTNRPDFLQLGMTKDYFVLSKENYEHILRNKTLSGYKDFFKQHYLND
ncbi:MAG: hypothetical protein RI973_2151 [Bacteroidota bacterium]